MLWEPWMVLDANIQPWQVDDYTEGELTRLIHEHHMRNRDGG